MDDDYTDGPLDERCHDCGALLDACRCPEPDDCDCVGLVHLNECPHWVLPY